MSEVLSIKGIEFTNKSLEESRFSCTVWSNECYSGVKVDINIDSTEDWQICGVTELGIGQLEHWSLESLWDWELEDVFWLQKFFLLELGLDLINSLHSRLGHGGKLGVSFESINEGLHMSNLLKLHLSQSHPLLSLLDLGFLELVEVTFEVSQLLVLELNDFIDDFVQEVLGVRHDDDGDVKGQDVLLQPDECNQIQMIGGLIQEEDFWLAENNLGDGDSHSPASREFLGWELNVFFSETKTDKDHGGLLFCFVGIDVVKSLVNFGESASVCLLDIFISGFVFNELGLFFKKGSSLKITLQNMEKNALVVTNNLLLNLEDVEVLWHVVDFLTTDGVDESSLTGSISTNESVFTASGELDGGINEELF